MRSAFASSSPICRSTRRERLVEVDASLGRVGRVGQALAVALARRLVLEQLADLGEREPGVVAQALDEPQPLEVGRVVQAVVAVGARGRLEQPDLLVVADRAGRQADLGRDLLDPEESRLGGGRGGAGGHSTRQHTTTFTFT